MLDCEQKELATHPLRGRVSKAGLGSARKGCTPTPRAQLVCIPTLRNYAESQHLIRSFLTLFK